MGRRSLCRTRHSTCSTACASGLCPIEWSCATTWRCVNLLKVQQGPATGCALTVVRCKVRQRSLLRGTCRPCHRPLDTPLWNIVCDKLSFFLNSLPPSPPGSGRVSHQSPGNVSRLRPPARPAGLDIETQLVLWLTVAIAWSGKYHPLVLMDPQTAANHTC